MQHLYTCTCPNSPFNVTKCKHIHLVIKYINFTPLCMTIDGLLGGELQSFLKHLSDFLSTKWEKPYHLTFLDQNQNFIFPFKGNQFMYMWLLL